MGVFSLSSQEGVPENRMASSLISLCGLRDYEQASNKCCLLLIKEFFRFEREKGHKFQV